MILGIGIDLLDKNRIEKLYNKYSNKFVNKVLSNKEIPIFNQLNKDKKIFFLAKRFSVKESLLKALGIGLGRGILMNNVTILNDNLGKPYIKLDNISEQKIKNILELNLNNIKFDISITDERNLVNTIVIISEYENVRKN